MADRKVTVSLKANVDDYQQDVRSAARETQALKTQAERFADKDYSADLRINTRGAERKLSRFERTVRNSLRGAADELGALEADVDVSEGRRKLDQLRADMRSLSNQRVGVDIGAAGAQRKIELLRAELLKLANTNPEVDVQVDARAAQEKLRGVYDDINRLGQSRAAPKISVQGAQRAERQIDDVRGKLRRLDGVHARPSVSLDSPVVAGDRTRNVAAKVRVLRGDANLEQFERRVDRLDGRTATVDIRGDTHGLSQQARQIIGLITALAPAAVSASGAVVGAFASMANAASVAGSSIGTLGLAFYGVGDALDALNERQVAAASGASDLTTETENLREAMNALSPAGQRFVRFLFSVKPQLKELQTIAQQGVFPGVERGIRELLEVMPEFENLVGETAEGLGDLAARGGAALNSPFWRNYIDFVAAEAKPQMRAWGTIIGNVAEGFAGLQQRLDPAADQWTAAFVRMSGAFREWAANSAEFDEFVAYVQEISPEVRDTIGEIAEALLDVAKAIAPFSSGYLAVIRGLANTLSAIANTGKVGETLFATAAALTAVNGAFRAYNSIKHAALFSGLATLEKRGGRAAAGLGKARVAVGRFAGKLGVLGAALAVTEAIFPSLIGANERYARSLIGTVDGTTNLAAKSQLAQRRIDSLAGPLPFLSKTFARLGFAIGDNVQKMAGLYDASGKLQGRVVTLETKAQKLGTRYKSVRDALFDYRRALDQFGSDSPQYYAALGQLQKSVEAVTNEQGEAATATEQHNRAMQKQFDKILGGLEVEASYKEAVDRLTAAIDEGSVAYDTNTDAGRKGIRMLGDAIRAAQKDINKKRKQNGVTEETERTAKSYQDRLFKLADQLGVTDEEVRGLIDSLDNTPRNVRTTFHFDGLDTGIQKTSFLGKLLGSYTGASKFTVPPPSGLEGLLLPQGRAAGGPVRGPGSSRSDSIPAMAGRQPYRLSDGEFVTNAKVTKQQGPGRMHALNSGRADIVPRADGGPVGLADGGEVRGSVTGDFSPVVAELERIQQKLAPPGGGSAYTGRIPQFRGNQLWKSLRGIVKSEFPNAVLTSSRRYGAGSSLHNVGKATDWDFYGDPDGGPRKWALYRWLRRSFPNSSELIWSPGSSIFEGRPTGFAPDHYDHVHWAMRSRSMLSPAAPGSSGGSAVGNQLSNADTIANVTRNVGLGRRALVVALSTALQESGLQNLHYGDRDSQGLFQQRPSQGWGTVGQITNPRLATRAFYGVARHTSNPGLTDVAGWRGLPVTVAAQRVQRSGRPNAYADDVPKARRIATQVGFDDGGLARARGFIHKLTNEPERVLSPQQTRDFEKLVDWLEDHDLDRFVRGLVSDAVDFLRDFLPKVIPTQPSTGGGGGDDGGGSGGGDNTVIINNPTPEPASDTIQHTLARQAALGLFR